MPSTSSLSARLTGPLLVALVLLSIAHGLTPDVPRLYAGLAAWAAGLILLRRVRGLPRIQFIAMVSLGSAGLLWAALQGREMDWESIVATNEALLAMLAAVSFLRLIALPPENDGSESGTTQLHRLPRGPGALASTLLGVHLFGAVINLSAVMIMGDRLAARGRLAPTQAKVLSRGFAMAGNWSPFFAAMGVALTNAPGADLPVLVSFGLPVAALALAFSALELIRRGEAQGFEGYPIHLQALWLPAILAAAVLLIHGLRPSVPILTLVSALSLSVTLVVLGIREGTPGLARLTGFVRHGLPRMSGELVLFLAAGVLASGIAAATQAAGLTMDAGHFGILEAFGLLVAIVALSIIGIHPVISIATAGGLLLPLAPDPNLLALVFLTGWSLGVVLSPLSGLHLAIQGRYGIDAHRFPLWHWRFGLFVLAVDLAALTLYGLTRDA